MDRIVIVGGGFAGVWAALSAARTRQRVAGRRDVAITLVNRDPWLTIRPRLYEASLDNLRVPLDAVIGPADIELVEAEVTRLDPAKKTVAIDGAAGPAVLKYDRLVLAAGSHVRRPVLPGAKYAFSVDSYAEAAALQRHLASLPTVNELPARDARFAAVVVGAGFTGIEVATELAARLRAIATGAGHGDRARVVLVERAPVAGPDLSAGARRHVDAALSALGIALRPGSTVVSVDPGGVVLNDGERIAAGTTVWTGGFHASSLAAQLSVELDANGRIAVDPFLRVLGVDSVYAAGDVARAMADADHVAPMSCQFAIPMGDRAGSNAAAELLGGAAEAFAPAPYVTCLDLGEAGALFMEGWDRDVKLTGRWAKTMKQTINTRLIYPPQGLSGAGAGVSTRPAA